MKIKELLKKIMDGFALKVQAAEQQYSSDVLKSTKLRLDRIARFLLKPYVYIPLLGCALVTPVLLIKVLKFAVSGIVEATLRPFPTIAQVLLNGSFWLLACGITIIAFIGIFLYLIELFCIYVLAILYTHYNPDSNPLCYYDMKRREKKNRPFGAELDSADPTKP